MSRQYSSDRIEEKRLKSAIKQRRRIFQKRKKPSAKTKIRRAERQREYNKRLDVKMKQSAYQKVRRALLNGALVKSPCKCGNPNVHAHHEDYSKPLIVDWLCPRCHAREHKRSPRYGIHAYDSV